MSQESLCVMHPKKKCLQRQAASNDITPHFQTQTKKEQRQLQLNEK
jgi:hypothetical protein